MAWHYLPAVVAVRRATSLYSCHKAQKQKLTSNSSAMNISSIAVTAFLLSSLSITEGALKGTRSAAGLEEGRGLKKNVDVCGPGTDTTCVSTFKARSSHSLVDCLTENDTNTYMDTLVPIVQFYIDGIGVEQDDYEVHKLTFPQKNITHFEKANFNAGRGYPRFPAGIFYAESEDEVIMAVNCAREAGYKISPRGRGHSYQGLSSMDGYLVIDMSLMCVPDEFGVTRFDEDEQPWILGEGQRAIGSIKSGSGCTNAVMLAFTSQEFPEGIYLIGSCPTVGITGYATGGGQGDTTPWVGLGIDDVLSYDIVLYNGTLVTASATSNPDLYWALRGGGSGFGVITSLETAVLNAPPESSGGFTFVSNFYKQTQSEAREFLKRFQDFLVPDLPIGSKKYKEKIRMSSAKFGGSASYYTNSSEGPLHFTGLFLGSKDEANSTFTEAGLFDPEILDYPALLEFGSYADTQMFIVCNTMSTTNYSWPSWTHISIGDNGRSDVCEDLGIDSSKYCHEIDAWTPPIQGYKVRIPNCDLLHHSFDMTLNDVKNFILPAMKRVALEPQSWFNRPGEIRTATLEIDPEFDINGTQRFWNGVGAKTWDGGLLHGRVDPDVLLEMANVGVDVFHLAHGAPTLVGRDETGYHSREEYSLLNIKTTPIETDQYDKLTSILVNQVYDGDRTKLRGFYNYLNFEGNRDWRNYYFGDNYEQLSIIKAKYDETNGFGNPLQVQPAPLSSKAAKENVFE